MFDHDNFINKPCQNIFGRLVIYSPRNTSVPDFKITGDFHENYVDINLQNAGADISAAEIVLFVRMVEFCEKYPRPLAGDKIVVDGITYQIIDIQPHIPGSKKLVLHEDI